MTTIPTDSIHWHPLIRNLPRWADDSPEMESLAADVALRGIDQPLVVAIFCGKERVTFLLDGRHRHRAASMAGLGQVPVIVRDEADAEAVIISSLVQRRHYTKSALAYVCFPMFAAKVQQRSGRPKKLSNDSTISDSALRMEEIARQLGVSRELIIWAKDAHELFTERPDLREKFEPHILSGELSLNRLASAIAGRESTIGKQRETPEIHQLLLRGFAEIKGRFGRWDKLADQAREHVATEWVSTLYELPNDLQLRTYQALSAKFSK